jgi:tetratricopeptide (TPR) repeat protein
MDCRKSLVLALGLFASSLGCNLLPQSPSGPTTTAENSADKEKPKRQPKPDTCVKLAVMREQTAEDPKLAPAERDKARDDARIEYQQALSIDPGYLPALQGLARLFDAMKDHEKAVATYQKALQLYPKDAAIWYELGMSHARQKEWDPAIQSLRTALDLEPDNQQCTTTLGFTMARAGQYEESYEFFRRQLGEARAHYNLARMLHHLQQDELSRQQAQLALQADSQLTVARELLDELDGLPAVGSRRQ